MTASDVVASPIGALLGQLGSGEADLADLLPIHRRLIAMVVDKAIGLVSHGKIAEGEALLVQVCAYDPRQPVFWLLLGATREKREDFAAAIADYGRGLLVAADDPKTAQELQLARGRALIIAGQIEAGRADLARAEQGPNPKHARIAGAALSATAQEGSAR